jgi:hypothetical protein
MHVKRALDILAPRMTRTALIVLAALALPCLAAGCGGGSGAALTYHVFPGDRVVNGRRLESLARIFENTYGCTETDTIAIVGIASQTYNVDGCAHTADYQLACRSGGGGYGGYGGGQRCEWEELASLAAQAAMDFRCDAQSIDQQIVQGPMRTVSGCGYQATYQLQGPTWMLAGRIEQVGPVTTGTGGVVVQGSGTAYIQ